MKKLILKTLVTVLLIQAVFFVSPLTVHAKKDACPPPTTVSIDIKPGEYPNKINLSANGLLPVAVLSTENFDASQFFPEMAHLNDAATAMGCAGAEAVRWNYTDVNSDGLVDLVFFFRIQDLNLTPSSTAATLMAHGFYNAPDFHIVGTDSVQVKP